MSGHRIPMIDLDVWGPRFAAILCLPMIPAAIFSVNACTDLMVQSGRQSRGDVAECRQRCEGHPVLTRTTKPDGSLGCICDETRTVR